MAGYLDRLTSGGITRDSDTNIAGATASGAIDVFNTVDSGTKDATDTVLDNDTFSVQDTARAGFLQAPMSAVESVQQGEPTWVTGDQAAEGFEQADDGTTSWIDNQVEGTALEDGRLGTLTDGARWLTDTLVTDTGRIALGTATGVDTEDGSTDYEVGAMDVAEIGITAATAGTGKAATSALRSGDDAGGLVSRVVGNSDEGAEVTAQRGNQGGQTAAQRSNQGGQAANSRNQGSGTGTGAQAADDTPELVASGEDATSFTRSSNEAADTFTIADNTAYRSGTSAADEGTALAQRIGDTARRFMPNVGRLTPNLGRTGKTIAGGGAVIGGGALVASSLNDEYETQDYVFRQTDNFEKTSEHPEGGALYEAIRKGEEGNEIDGYTVIVGQQGSSLIMVDGEGNRTTAPLAASEFSSSAAIPSGGDS